VPNGIVLIVFLVTATLLFRRYYRRCHGDQQSFVHLISARIHQHIEDGYEADLFPVLTFTPGGIMNTGTTIHRAITGDKDRLVNDLKNAFADANNLLQDISEGSVEEFSAACTKIEETLIEVRSRLGESCDTATRTAHCTAAAAKDYVIQNPGKIVGAAVATGLIIGILLARR